MTHHTHRVRDFFIRGSATLGIAALAACGGGGSTAPTALTAPPVTLAPAPTPTPTPSPSPTPIATPTPLAGPAALTAVGDFAVLGASHRSTTEANGSGARDVVDQFEGIGFRYLASGVHELLIPGFDWGQLGGATSFDPAFSTSSVSGVTAGEPFRYSARLLVPGDRNSLLPLAYTGLALWEAGRFSRTQPNLIEQNSGGFAYGVPTLIGSLPLSGTTTYRGLVYDSGYGDTGALELSIDFASGAVSGFIAPTLNDGIGGIATIGRFSFGATVLRGATSFTLPVPIPATGQTGEIAVRFTGPEAQEVMIRFTGAVRDPHNPDRPLTLVVPGAAKRD